MIRIQGEADRQITNSNSQKQKSLMRPFIPLAVIDPLLAGTATHLNQTLAMVAQE